MKQKVGGIINQKLLRRNRLDTFRSFTHMISQASTIHNNKPSPFIANAHHARDLNLAWVFCIVLRWGSRV
jgi:hypothetical protein